MTIALRAPKESELAEVFRLDGRNFGFAYTAEQIERRRRILEHDRYRVAFDGRAMVGMTGTCSFAMTVPGGNGVPVAGVTWVSVAATHRRQGLLRRLMDASLTEAIDHGDAAAVLTASEAGIYERFGYGVASQMRLCRLDRQAARVRADMTATERNTVRFVEDDDALDLLPPIYERYRTTRPGELSRSDAWWRALAEIRSLADGDDSPTFYAAHRDGYVAYRVKQEWHSGHVGGSLTVIELVAVTVEAHRALWHFVLGIDLIKTIETKVVPIDDPLPWLLVDPRQVRTAELNDGLWVRPLDVRRLLGERSYATDDTLVIEVVDDTRPELGGRFEVTGGADGATCRQVRRRIDITVGPSGLGSLSLGGVRASVLARGGRLDATSPAALRRADAFFPAAVAPHHQTQF